MIPKLEVATDELKARAARVEGNLDPILQTADTRLRELTECSEEVNEDLRASQHALMEQFKSKLGEVETKHFELIQHAKGKFDEMEQTQATLFDGAKGKFGELDTKQEAMIRDGAQRFAVLDTMSHRLEALERVLAGMQVTDVSAIYQRVAEAGLRSDDWDSGLGRGGKSLSLRPSPRWNTIRARGDWVTMHGPGSLRTRCSRHEERSGGGPWTK